MITESEMYNFEDKNIKVKCINGNVVEGKCIEFTQALDNEPEVASITLRTNIGGLVEIMQTEIKEIVEV